MHLHDIVLYKFSVPVYSIFSWHSAIPAVNTAALRPEIYYYGGKRIKIKIDTIPNRNRN